MNRNDECWKRFDENSYRCKCCGTFQRCKNLKREEQLRKEQAKYEEDLW